MILNENSLYTNQQERQELIDNPEKLSKLFITTFLGFIALYGSGPRKQVLTSYLRSEKQVTLRNIKDDNNDLSLVVQLATEAGIIRRSKAMEMTKLLYLLKKISIDEVNEEAIKELVEPNKILLRELKGRYRSEYAKYIDGTTNLYQMIYALRQFIRSDDQLSTEFKDIFIRYIPQLKEKAGITDDMDDDDLDAGITSVSNTDQTVVEPEGLTPAQERTAARKEKALDKAETKEKVDKIKAQQETQPISTATPEYDLTNRNSVTDAFIEIIKSDNPGRFLKSIGSSLEEFPWGLARNTKELAYTYYKHFNSTKLAKSRLNTLIVYPVGDFAFRKEAKNKDKQEILRINGLIEAFKRGEVSPIDYFRDAYSSYYNNPEIFLGLRSILTPIKEKLEDNSSRVDLIIEILKENYDFNQSTNRQIFDLFDGKLSELLEELSNKLPSLDASTRFVVFSHILGLLSGGHTDPALKNFKLYIGTPTLDDYFNSGIHDFISFLDDNDWFDEAIREYRPKDISGLNSETPTSELYETLKGVLLNNVGDDLIVKLLNYIKENNLIEDYTLSFDGGKEVVYYILNENSNNLRLDVSKLYGAPEQFESEFQLLLGEHILRKNSKNIFKEHEYNNLVRVFRNIVSLFTASDDGAWYNNFEPYVGNGLYDLINKLSTEYGPIVAISNIGLVMSEYKYKFDKSVTPHYDSILLNRFKFDVKFDDTVTPKNLVELITKEGVSELINPYMGTVLSFVEHIVKHVYDRDTIDGLFGSGFFDEFNKEVLSLLVNTDVEDSADARNLIGDKYRHNPEWLIGIFEALPSSDNAKIKYAVEKIRKAYSLLNESAPAFTTFLIDRNLIKIKDVSDEELYDIYSEIDKEGQEDRVDEFLSAIYKDRGIDWFMSEVDNLGKNRGYFRSYKAIKESNPEEAEAFIEKSLENSQENYFYGYGDDDNITWLKPKLNELTLDSTGVVSDELKQKIANKILLDISSLPNKAQNHCANHETFSGVAVNASSEILDDIASGFSPSVKSLVVRSIVSQKVLSQSNIFDNVMNAEIRPQIDLSVKRFIEILEYNGISISVKNIRQKKSETYSDFIKRATELSIDNYVLEDLKTELIQESEEMLKRRAVEYDNLYTNGKHGDLSLKFLRSFDVSDDWTHEDFYQFKEEYPDTMIPVFHGTGTVAASMILRQGFAIIDAGDASAVGRMLGNGIYFSNIMDKAALYVSDQGYNRGPGQEGYLFEMEAILGKKDIDYKEAGTGNDSILSPEWAVFNPQKQLSIKKAHHVVTVSKSEIEKYKEELNESTSDYSNANITPLVGFADWIRPLKESIKVDMEKYSCTFIFRDGNIPLADGNIVSWRNAYFNTENVKIDSSQMGIAVTVYYTNSNIPLKQAYVIGNSRDFVSENTLEYQLYHSLVNGIESEYEE